MATSPSPNPLCQLLASGPHPVPPRHRPHPTIPMLFPFPSPSGPPTDPAPLPLAPFLPNPHPLPLQPSHLPDAPPASFGSLPPNPHPLPPPASTPSGAATTARRHLATSVSRPLAQRPSHHLRLPASPFPPPASIPSGVAATVRRHLATFALRPRAPPPHCSFAQARAPPHLHLLLPQVPFPPLTALAPRPRRPRLRYHLCAAATTPGPLATRPLKRG